MDARVDGRQSRGPPPVPVRLQQERGIVKLADSRWDPREENDTWRLSSEAVGRHARQPEARSSKVEPTAPQSSTLQRTYEGERHGQQDIAAMERRLLAMEHKVLNLEASRREEAQAYEAKLMRLEKSLGRTFDDQQQHQPRRDFERDARQTAEIAQLRQLVEGLSKQMATTENIVLSRNSALDSLSSTAQRSGERVQAIETEVSQLKSAIISHIDPAGANQTTENKVQALLNEVARLGQISQVLNSRIDQGRNVVDGKIAELDNQGRLIRNELDQLAQNEHDLREQTKLFMQQNSAKLSDLERQSSFALQEADRVRVSIKEIDQVQERALAEARERVERFQAKMSEKLEQQTILVAQTVAEDRSIASEERRGESARITAQLSKLGELIEMTRRESELRNSKLQESVLYNRAEIDSRLAEMSSEYEMRLDQMAMDIRREETNRMDQVRRVHEDLLDQMESLHYRARLQNNQSADPLSPLGQDSTGVKCGSLGELEEVVRAEVRSRLRHETKLREHVENTTIALRATLEANIKDVDQAVRSLEGRSASDIKDLGARLEDGLRSAAQLNEERDTDRQLAIAEGAERLAAVESRLVKRMQVQETNLDRIQEMVEKNRSDATVAVAVVTGKVEQTRADCEHLHHLALGNTAEVGNGLSARMDYAAQELQVLRESLASQVEQAANIQSERLEDATNVLRAQMEELNQGIIAVEARTASEACLQQVMHEVELREVSEQLRSASDAQLARAMCDLQESIQSGLGDHLRRIQDLERATAESSAEILETGAKIDVAFESLDSEIRKGRTEQQELRKSLEIASQESQARARDVDTRLSAETLLRADGEATARAERKLIAESVDRVTAELKDSYKQLRDGLVQGEQMVKELQDSVGSIIQAALDRQQADLDTAWLQAVEQAQGYLDVSSDGGDVVPHELPYNEKARQSTAEERQEPSGPVEEFGIDVPTAELTTSTEELQNEDQEDRLELQAQGKPDDTHAGSVASVESMIVSLQASSEKESSGRLLSEERLVRSEQQASEERKEGENTLRQQATEGATEQAVELSKAAESKESGDALEQGNNIEEEDEFKME